MVHKMTWYSFYTHFFISSKIMTPSQLEWFARLMYCAIICYGVGTEDKGQLCAKFIRAASKGFTDLECYVKPWGDDSMSLTEKKEVAAIIDDPTSNWIYCGGIDENNSYKYYIFTSFYPTDSIPTQEDFDNLVAHNQKHIYISSGCGLDPLIAKYHSERRTAFIDECRAEDYDDYGDYSNDDDYEYEWCESEEYSRVYPGAPLITDVIVVRYADRVK